MRVSPAKAGALRRRGQALNLKRGQRLGRQERLQVPLRKPKKRKPPGTPTPVLPTQRPGHVWSLDFVFDATANPTRLKILSVGDDFTRDCLAIAVATSLPCAKGSAVLSRLVAAHAAPAYLSSDTGPECIADALKVWLATQQTQTAYIQKGSAWQNGFRESCHAGFCEESLRPMRTDRLRPRFERAVTLVFATSFLPKRSLPVWRKRGSCRKPSVGTPMKCVRIKRWGI